MNRMIAQFILPATRLLDIAERDAKKSGVKVSVQIHPIGNGAICGAVGPTQSIMFLIGVVAAETENALYKAEAI